MALAVKALPANAADVRDLGSVPGFGRCPGGGDGNLLQYSSLENPIERGALWPAVHWVITSGQIDGETIETVTDFIFWAPKPLQMVTTALKLKDACSLEEKL